jgi:MoaA/NifB/PqqE/SkfB family radical SAM enzyme
MAEAMQIFSAPLTFNWTLSYRCNFSCEHCYSRDEECPELAIDEIKRIVDVLAEQQVPFINFGGGEPLIRKDIYEVAEYAAIKGLNVSMNTNGWLLDETTAMRLKDAGFKSVGVSIDSSEATLHDAFRNMPGSYARAVRGLDALHHVGLKSTMSSVISRINYQTFRKLLDLARAHGVEQVSNAAGAVLKIAKISIFRRQSGRPFILKRSPSSAVQMT